jgi:hypothetical protein
MCPALCALLVGCASSPDTRTSSNVQATAIALNKAEAETLMRSASSMPAAILRLWEDGKGKILSVCLPQTSRCRSASLSSSAAERNRPTASHSFTPSAKPINKKG